VGKIILLFFLLFIYVLSCNGVDNESHPKIKIDNIDKFIEVFKIACKEKDIQTIKKLSNENFIYTIKKLNREKIKNKDLSDEQIYKMFDFDLCLKLLSYEYELLEERDVEGTLYRYAFSPPQNNKKYRI
jgi:hypothetical protein